MKTLPLLLLTLSALAHADEARTCTVDGWLKMRPAPNAAGDIYGEPDWPEKIHLYPASGSREPLATLPDAMKGGTWDYLSVSLLGRAQNGRFPVEIAAYGATPDSIMPASGWLEAGHIGFGLQSGHLYAKPDAQSKRLLDVQGEWLHEIGDIILRDCAGEWIQIDYRQRERRDPDASLTPIPEAEQKTLEGVWVRGVCPTLETTCDMPDADKKP